MPALFPAWTNTAFRLAIAVLVLTPIAGLAGLMLYVRSPWNTQQFVRLDQPVEFDHRHHVVDDEIDCLYCHPGAETSRFAGVPATEVCMGCHSQIWNQSPLLEVVRRSYFSNVPITWNRVHDVPDFTYFDHSVHTSRGVGCVHCHGRVDQMPRVEKVAPLTMQWCLSCHRDPAAVLKRNPPPRPEHDALWGAPERVLDGFANHPVRDIDSLTTCTACHR